MQTWTPAYEYIVYICILDVHTSITAPVYTRLIVIVYEYIV